LTRGLWAFPLAMLLVIPLAAAGEGSARGAKELKKESKKEPEKSVFGANKKEPIVITSDRMEVDQRKNAITYTGRVAAQQGETTLNSQVLTAYYDPEMKGLREVIAEGQVQVTQGGRVATGSKAVFSDRDQTITLTGNPVVRQGNSQVSGARIIFFMEQDRAVVEGGGQRVKATIFPEEMQKREEEKGVTDKSR
jgi:lipopolysaccharide export system protein LptA